ncbi:MAG TPA: hypothetical protein VI564_01320, partial [Candidatus Nanoarchaeia archaeon]|nr:hypothetical protein [Candidatus Nanoarchaeia archaeon]
GSQDNNSMPDFPDLDSDLSSQGNQKEGDLPPSVPAQQEAEPQMPDFPQLPDFEELHEPNMDIPPISMPEGDLEADHNYQDYSISQQPEQEQTADLQSLDDDFEMPQIPKQPILSKPAVPDIQQVPKSQVVEKRRLFAPRENVTESSQPESLYIRVDKFKDILGNVNVIRTDLKKYENSLGNLQDINNSKNNSSEKIKAMLNDLQKKIIFIDRTLFKGGD